MDGVEKSDLSAFNERLARMHLRGQWTAEINNRGATDGPVPRGVPHVWRYGEVMKHLHEACKAFPDVLHARRALTFDNPALDRYTTHTLAAGLQMIQPDELAWPHRHTASALRFVIEGDPDLVTIVNGVSHPMQDYDLILTPGWSWHAHKNKAERNVVWLDLLDVPLILMLNQTFFEAGQQGNMDTGKDDARPAATMRFAWADMERKLRALADAEEIDPHFGATCAYAEPITGGPTLPTVSCNAHLLRPGERTARSRRTASAVYFVIDGEGRTVVGDTEVRWAKHDTFCVPNWSWQEHENLSRSGEAFLFSIDDSPMLRALNLLRMQGADDGVAGAGI